MEPMRIGGEEPPLIDRRLLRREEGLGAAARIHARVVSALILREIHTRFGHFRAGYLWAVVEPVAHIVLFAFIVSMMGHSAPLGDSLEVFVASAIIPFFLFRDVEQRVAAARSANRALLFFPIVKVIDTVISRILLECVTWFLISVFTMTLLAGFGFNSRPADPLACIAALGGGVWMGSGFGLFSSAAEHFSPAWEKFMGLAMRPLYLASGILYLPTAVPAVVRDVIGYLPTAHLVDWVRAGFFEGYESDFYSPSVVMFTGLVFWTLGLTMERLLRARREAE